MGVSALFLVTGLFAFLIAGYRGVLRARGRRKPTDVPLMVSVVALGLAFVFLAPAVQAVESALVPSLGRLLSNVSTLVAAFGFLHLMLYITHPAERVPAKARTRLILLLVSIGVMTVMFFVSTPPTGIGIFSGLYRAQPTLAVYTLVYSLYLGAAVVELGKLALGSVRYVRSWLRLGMSLIAVGCLLGAGYLAHKAFGVLNELITATVPAESYCPSAFATVGCTFGVGLPALSSLAILLGATLPTLGPRLERLIRAIGHWRAYRRLHPLWAMLREALPDVTLAAPDLPPDAPPGGLSERLYRRVVGIRDGLLALQPYRTPDQPSNPADSTGHVDQYCAADIEAAHIRTALRRRAHNVTPGDSVVPTAPQSDDLASEIRWLTQVSDALARTEVRPAERTQPAR